MSFFQKCFSTGSLCFKEVLMHRIFITCFLLLVIGQAHASFENQKELSNWVTYYYKKKEPEKVVSAVQYMSENNWFDKQSSVPPLFGFLAGIFSENPKNVEGWLNEINLKSESHYSVIVFALWYSNIKSSQKITYKYLDHHPTLKSEFAFLYKGSPMSVGDIPLQQGPWVLDAMWGNFMSTGNSEPVIKIISTLPWLNSKGDINKISIGGSARWSLISNSIQHPLVLKICKDQIEKQPSDVAEALKQVIAEAEKEIKSAENNET